MLWRVNERVWLENIDLVQVIMAYCQISDNLSARQREFDKLVGFIKVITANIFDKDGPSVLCRLYGLFSENVDKSFSYSTSNLILLLVYVYALIGEDCYQGVEEEDRIKVFFIHYLPYCITKSPYQFYSRFFRSY